MFNISADVKENDQALQAMQAALKELENTQVLVGIPEDDKARKEGHISNAALLYIHSHGSPEQKIPPRPVIEPALEANKERLGEVMGKATKAAMAGDSAGMRRNLELAGKAGRDFSKAWFTDPRNGWKELKHGRGGEREVEFTGKDGSKTKVTFNKGKKAQEDPRPLIDTGQLRNSITYVLRERD